MTEPDHDPTPVEPPSPPPVRPARRRWLRFGLRTMLGLVLLVALVLGWWANSAHRQRQAVATIRAAYPEAVILYDNQPFEEDSYVRNPQPINPESNWFRGLIDRLDRLPRRARLPNDYLHSVVSLGISDQVAPKDETNTDDSAVVAAALSFHRLKQLSLDIPVRDADLVGLKHLTRLRNLGLTQPTGLTDAGFASIAAVPSLRQLTISDCPVTDAGLARLGTLTQLEQLFLGSSVVVPPGPAKLRVTGTGLSKLTGLPYFQTLSLNSACLTHKGISGIGSLPHLSLLVLNGPVATNDLPLMAGLRELDDLGLVCTNINGKGLEALGQLPKLRCLALTSELMDNSALPDLAQILTLRRVDLIGTDVTPAGVASLRSLRPDLNVQTSPLPPDIPRRPRPTDRPPIPSPSPSG